MTASSLMEVKKMEQEKTEQVKQHDHGNWAYDTVAFDNEEQRVYVLESCWEGDDECPDGFKRVKTLKAYTEFY